MPSIADIRRDYASRELDERDAAADPVEQFGRWFEEAVAAAIEDVNAMTLATVSPAGTPDARTVLLKGFDARGFVFFTNYESAKGRDLAAHAHACLVLFWGPLERQVRIRGAVTRVSQEESAAYFASRPLTSQLGAWASPQSTPIAGRDVLEKRSAAVRVQFADQPLPVPPFWGGYRVEPAEIEFWQGRPSRLHDRLLYRRQADDRWTRVRLAP